MSRSAAIAPPSARLAGLDLLRLPAAFALLLCHAGFWLAPFGWPDAFWWMLGHLGVEVFLVCAAFLAARRAFAAPHFLPGRAIVRGVLRLWPLYALFLAANLLLAPAAPVPAGTWLPYVVLGQNLGWPHPPFFGEAWIVAAAMLLAVVVPLLCAGLRRLGAAAGLAVLVAGIAVGWLVRALVVAATDPDFDEGVRKILLLRLDLPFYGVLVAWLAARRPVLPAGWRGAMALVGAGVLGGVVHAHLHGPMDASFAARVAVPGLADLGWALLVAAASTLALPDRFARGLAVLADAAYAGLLSHMTLLRVLLAAGAPLLVTSRAHGLGLLLAYLVAATLLAILVSRCLDRPWRRRLAQRLPPVAER